nr:PREDICTED: olfactory receptor 10H1-like [Latimeria chalumnae]|eukprot:XP_014353821.1 PREDICTED: olfactory receptor 10H1-like [Latimeria chalumnae]
MESVHNITTTFILSGFGKTTSITYFYFACSFVLYAMTILVNIFLIAVIVLEKSLHGLMYICLCHLAVNKLCGSTAIPPHLKVNLLSVSKTISYSACFAQLFFIYTYGVAELTVLTVMAYDRYVAMCNPLRYGSIMTDAKTQKLLLFAWTYSLLSLITILSLCSLTIPPLFNPIIYGMKTESIKTGIKNVLGKINISMFGKRNMKELEVVQPGFKMKAFSIRFNVSYFDHWGAAYSGKLS